MHELSERYYSLSGILGPLIALVCIAAAIILSPWFSWGNNALSDLGHSVNSDVAPLFNFGLLLCGFLVIFYSLTSFKSHAKYTSYFLVTVGLTLQLVGTFDEVYGSLHFLVSVLFFVSLCFVSVSYIIEKRSVLAVAALIIGLASWILYGLDVYQTGIAVPEAISSIPVVVWVVLSAVRLFLGESKS
ncbi:MAG: hypothetical protein CW691_00490 [Candidatus Bathyarchaeum sp.]|nr:MAG: hypothetical protein CW691_00490 [Candidatus Bathyarchaeum sp.]